jgi:hypothetical protein
MTMNFIEVKTALKALLAADGVTNGYRVIGHQRQITNMEEVLNNDKLVQVFYGEGDFDKGKGSRTGPTNHEMTFKVELYLAKGAEGDKSGLASATTDAERAAIIAAYKEAQEVVDAEFDLFANHVYNVLMDTRNDNIGMPIPPAVGSNLRVSNTWVSAIRKDTVMGDGEYSGLTGTLTFKCDVCEELAGDTGLPFDEGVDGAYSINTDPNLETIDEATPIAGQLLAKP